MEWVSPNYIIFWLSFEEKRLFFYRAIWQKEAPLRQYPATEDNMKMRITKMATAISPIFFTLSDMSKLYHAPVALNDISRKRPLVPEPRFEATSHLFIVNPLKPSFLLSLFSTHPPVEERGAAIACTVKYPQIIPPHSQPSYQS